MNYIPCISHRDRQYSREHQYILVWRFSLNCVKPWSYNINKHINPLCIMAKPWRWTPNRRYLDYASLMVTHGGCLVACVRRTSWCLVACESSRARPARPSKHSGVRPAENSWFSSFHGDRLPREHRERRVRSAAGTRDGVSSKLRPEKFDKLLPISPFYLQPSRSPSKSKITISPLRAPWLWLWQDLFHRLHLLHRRAWRRWSSMASLLLILFPMVFASCGCKTH